MPLNSGTSQHEDKLGSLQKDDFSLLRYSNNKKFLYILSEAIVWHGDQLHPTSLTKNTNESKMLMWKYNTDFVLCSLDC